MTHMNIRSNHPLERTLQSLPKKIGNCISKFAVHRVSSPTQIIFTGDKILVLANSCFKLLPKWQDSFVVTLQARNNDYKKGDLTRIKPQLMQTTNLLLRLKNLLLSWTLFFSSFVFNLHPTKVFS